MKKMNIDVVGDSDIAGCKSFQEGGLAGAVATNETVTTTVVELKCRVLGNQG